MSKLHPKAAPFDSGRLAVSERHTLHYEQVGREDGRPVLFVHGGPGAGHAPEDRRFFDPDRYRAVLFDQRGAGRSTPHADLRENTTDHLVADIERLRRHLGIDRWILFGGSWGSTLALAYAQRHPERVERLVLRGIFLCREDEIRWFWQHGASRFFPEAWEEFLAPIPTEERDDLLAAYARRLEGADEEAARRAARAWSIWEGRTSRLRPDQEKEEAFGDERFALAMARIENHYFRHGGFLGEDGALLAGARRLRGIPGHIVQGRYDVVCPPATAHALHRAWPDSEFVIVPDAGHDAHDPPMAEALVRIMDALAV